MSNLLHEQTLKSGFVTFCNSVPQTVERLLEEWKTASWAELAEDAANGSVRGVVISAGKIMT